MTTSKTAKKQKKHPGNPNIREINKSTRFKPNDPITGYKDPKINRKGRPPPKDNQELNALIDEIFSEQISDGKGHDMEKLRIAINRLLLNKIPAGPIHILDRRFGKVKEQVEHSGEVNNVITVRLVKDD